MAHRPKNRNGLSVASGIDSAVRGPLNQSNMATVAGPAPRNSTGMNLAAGLAPPETIRLAEPKSIRRASHQEIERRAYEIYLSRQGRPGTPQEDWVRAERELAARA